MGFRIRFWDQGLGLRRLWLGLAPTRAVHTHTQAGGAQGPMSHSGGNFLGVGGENVLSLPAMHLPEMNNPFKQGVKGAGRERGLGGGRERERPWRGGSQ